MAHLLFDYDGTLHDSIRIYAPAFRHVYNKLVAEGLAADQTFSDEEMKTWIGLNVSEFWDSFMPHLSDTQKKHCGQAVGDRMLELVRQDEARLYPHAEAVLRQLNEAGHTLVFLSNCKRAYMDAHRLTFHLNRYFSAFFCTEDYDFQPKYEVFNTIAKTHPGDYIIIGDRHKDMEIAEVHNLLSIGCAYGYGSAEELAGATMTVTQLDRIPAALDALT